LRFRCLRERGKHAHNAKREDFRAIAQIPFFLDHSHAHARASNLAAPRPCRGFHSRSILHSSFLLHAAKRGSRRQAVLRQPKTRAGRNKIALSKANKASKVIPTKRNGSDRSQTNGKTTRTRSANGHAKTRRRHQTRKAISIFTSLAFHSQMKGQPASDR